MNGNPPRIPAQTGWIVDGSVLSDQQDRSIRNFSDLFGD